MIRFELIKRVSEQFGVEEIDAGVFVDRIFESMISAFNKGKRINIPEFGKFNLNNKIVDGVRQRYVVFSPAKNFNDAVNKNFSDLEPLLLNAYNVRKNEILKVKEILPNDNEEDYLYFEFDSTEEEIEAVEETEVVAVADAAAEETAAVEEIVAVEETVAVAVAVAVEETVAVAVAVEETVAVEEIVADEETVAVAVADAVADETAAIEETVAGTVEETAVVEKTTEEEIKEEIPELDKLFQIESSVNSDTEQNIFTEIEPIITEDIDEGIKQEQSIFEEEIDNSILNQQTVFASLDDIVSQERIPLSEVPERSEEETPEEEEISDEVVNITPNAEEQIVKNKKVIEEVENISPLSVRVNLKDDMNIDNIKEEIFDILVKREEIIRELNAFNTSFEIRRDESKSNIPDENIIETHKADNIVKPEDIFESKEIPKIEETPKIDGIPKIEDDRDNIFAELEKRIRELDELSQNKEEIKKVDLNSPISQEMQIFGKLIDDTHVVNKEAYELKGFEEIIIHDTIPEVESSEPKSLSDALQDVKLDGVIEHMDINKDEDGVKSYDDIFRKSENQFIPQFSVESEEKHTQGRFFKIFLYLFFIFLLTAFSFYIYKTMFTNSTSNQVADTIGLSKIDSVRALLKKANDSIAKKDTSKIKEEEINQTESIEIKNMNGVVYRELRNKIYIQNKVVNDLNEASDLEIKLKYNNLNCIVEGATNIDNGLEYRILVGPFKSIEEAMEYYEKHKVVLNFIQIINPNKPNLLIF